MVLDDVPKRAVLVVVATTALDPDLLGHGDLHVVDVATVPDGLEDRVAEAEYEQVLHRLLSQIMVDAIHLLLVERLAELLVERSGARKIGSKGLLDHDPCESPVALLGQTRPAQVRRDQREELRGCREVVQAVAGGAHRFVDLAQQGCQPGERSGIVKAPRHVAQPRREALPDRLVGDLDPAVGVDAGTDIGAELVVGHLGTGESHDRRLWWQQALQGKVEEGRAQLALGQITRRAQDDDDRGRRRPRQTRCRIEGDG